MDGRECGLRFWYVGQAASSCWGLQGCGQGYKEETLFENIPLHPEFKVTATSLRTVSKPQVGGIRPCTVKPQTPEAVGVNTSTDPHRREGPGFNIGALVIRIGFGIL